MAEPKSKISDRNFAGQVWNFKGKYAEYINDLCGKEAKYPIFDQLYHGYAFCCMYGLVKGQRHAYDSNTDDPNKVDNVGFRWSSADKSGIYDYEMLRTMVLLFDKSSDKPFEDKVDDALRYDFPTNYEPDIERASKSRYADHSDLVDEYVLGGLELIHRKVVATNSNLSLIELFNEIIDDFEKEKKRRLEHVM